MEKQSKNTLESTLIETCISHRGYSLVKVSYAMFAFVFVYWFSDSGWFEYNLSIIGFPIIVLIMILSHFILLLLESKYGTIAFRWILKGKPAVFYKKWVCLYSCHLKENADTKDDAEEDSSKSILPGSGDAAFSYGYKRIRLDVIDELELSIWGNLLVKSKNNSGKLSSEEEEQYEPDVLAKLPLGAISQEEANSFVELIKEHSPDVSLNKRLSKKLDSKIVKGEEVVKSFGAIFLCFVLLDLGYSTGYFLEMQKHFFLSHAMQVRDDLYEDIKGQESRKKKALEEFQAGESLMNNRSSISLVQRALFDHGSAVGGVYQARAEALWQFKKYKEAIASLEKAHELYPKSLKLMIELSRWKYEQGDLADSKKVLEKAIEEHSEDLLPCLYMIAADKKDLKSDTEIENLCKSYLEKLDENVFGDEPWWPPGGNRFLSERLYRDDVLFLAKHLLDIKIK